MGLEKGKINVNRYGELEGAQYAFAGMNFFIDPADLDIESGQCHDICNCDIDYMFNVSRRKGYTQLLTFEISNLWSNGVQTFARDHNGNLVAVDFDVPELVTLLVAAAPIAVTTNLEFKQVNNIVVFSDGVIMGSIDTNYTVTVLEAPPSYPTNSNDLETWIQNWVTTNYPHDYTEAQNIATDMFKVRPTAGTCLEYFNGVLYYAVDNFVMCTKAFDIENADIRYQYVAGFPSDVTAIARVTDGLYIGTADHIYFLTGRGYNYNDTAGTFASGFSQQQVATYGIVKGSCVRVNSTLVPDAKAEDTLVLCASSLGLFALCNGGRYLNMSAQQINMPGGVRAAAFLSELNNIYQYIVTYNTADNCYYNNSDYPGSPLDIDPDTNVDTVVINTVNLCHSRYTHFAFNSFCAYGGSYYGACKKGLYKLVGDSDFVGEPYVDKAIEAIILTPTSDYEKQELKQPSDAFLHTRQTDDMLLDVLVDEYIEETDFTIIHDGQEGIHRRRVKLPRGLRGTDYQYRIRNQNGCDFTIFDFEVFIKTLKRII